MTKRNSGKNIWINWNNETVKSGVCPGEGWFPSYNPRRVTGDSYEPYSGLSEWEQRANKAMAQQAQYNFSNR